MFKALSIGTFIPTVKSETKTNSIAPKYRRATILPRAANSSVSRASSASWVPYLSAAALAGVVVTLGFQLFMVNAYATKGYELKRHQQAVRELGDEQKYLLVQQSEMGSISKVNDVAGLYGLVPVTDEEFLTTSQLTQK
jgi:hypothetical protein